jgi:hypothetical protein
VAYCENIPILYYIETKSGKPINIKYLEIDIPHKKTRTNTKVLLEPIKRKLET